MNISSEQQSTIRQTITRTNIQPATNVNFSVSVGSEIPSTVVLHDVPEEIVRIVPAWRSYKVVRVRDEIIIIQPQTRKIVYVINA